MIKKKLTESFFHPERLHPAWRAGWEKESEFFLAGWEIWIYSETGKQTPRYSYAASSPDALEVEGIGFASLDESVRCARQAIDHLLDQEPPKRGQYRIKR